MQYAILSYLHSTREKKDAAEDDNQACVEGNQENAVIIDHLRCKSYI